MRTCILKLPSLIFTIQIIPNIFAETCLKHEVYSISENKCVSVCQTDITVCMESGILSQFFTSDRKIDFGVTCSTNPDSPGACNCDLKKGLIKTDPLNQFSKCKGPENWCKNLDFQEYACDEQEKTCTCVDRKSKCKTDDFYTSLNQTCTAETGEIKCDEGFKVSEHSEGEVEVVCVEMFSTTITEVKTVVEIPRLEYCDP